LKVTLCGIQITPSSMSSLQRPPRHRPLALYSETTDNQKPFLVPFYSTQQSTSSQAIIVLPGGGYGGLSEHEGEGYANFLNLIGIHAFVLHYRLGSEGHRHPSMLEDVARAIRMVRAYAEAWGIDPSRIGVMGSSAGGHLASTVMTHFDAGNTASTDPVERVSSRPDIAILAYPVVTMLEKTHVGSRNNLLGENPSQELLEKLSAELQVDANTPPCFIWHTLEDGAVPAENSSQLAAAMRAAGVPCELHLFEHGGHGLGLKSPHPWLSCLSYWLRKRGWTPHCE